MPKRLPYTPVMDEWQALGHLFDEMVKIKYQRRLKLNAKKDPNKKRAQR